MRTVAADVRLTPDDTKSHAVPRIRRLDRFAVALTATQPIRIHADVQDEVSLPQGTSVSIPIVVESPGAASEGEKLSFAALPLPKGVRAEFGKRGEADSTVILKLSAAGNASAGPFSLMAQAKIARGGADSVVTAPPVTVNVTKRQ
jgi:hypothetical protein